MATGHLFQESEEHAVGDLDNPISHPTIRGAQVDGTEQSAYKVSKEVNQSIRTGTQVPIATTTGGIAGTKDLVGYVKPGKQWEIDKESGHLVPVGPSIIDPQTVESCTNGVQETNINTAPVKKQTKRQQKNTLAIETILKEMPEVMQPAAKKIKVKLSGYFGEFVGSYLQAVKEKNLVVLAMEEDANGFVPPVSQEDQTFTLTMYTESSSVDCEVQYLGLTFTMLEMRFFLYHAVG